MARPPRKAAGSSRAASKPQRRLTRKESEGRERLAKELARQQKRKEERANSFDVPYRFFVKKGNSAELIICDEAASYWRYEHNYKGESGYRDQYCACLQETEICPACKALPDSRAYFGMFLTVIDCTGYTKQDGTEVPFTKKLLVIKSQQQEKWNRRIDAHIEKYGTLRGAVVEVYRSQGETAPATGDDIEFTDHEDLDCKRAKATYKREYDTREGKHIVEDLTEVLDYELVFPEPTVEELEEKFNVAPPAGSDRANASAGRATRRGAPVEEEDEYESTDRDDTDWEDEQPSRPSRGRPTAAKSAPAKRTRRARR